MKLTMYIPDKNFHEILNGFLSNESKRKLRDAIKNGIALPDNATNGDVIKALFPDATVYSYKDSYDMYSDVVICPQNSMLAADRDWWNAPYKGGQSVGDAWNFIREHKTESERVQKEIDDSWDKTFIGG